MRKFFGSVMAVVALGVQAQTTNLWIGPTNVAAIGSWTNVVNWSPDIPDTITEVASFTADFTVNAAVTLDGTQTVYGLVFNDTGASKQSFTINAGTPPGMLVFGGASPFVNVPSATEALPLTIATPTDYASFTKLGGGWLRLTSLISNDLPPALSVPAGALLLDQSGSNLNVTAAGFVKSGPAQLVTQNGMTLLGTGNIVVNDGRFEVRKGSTNLSGNIIVNSNAQFVARQLYSNQFGDTNGTTTVNATAQAKFQDPLAFTNGETWILNGFRADGSLQMDYADAMLTGPINITTNTHININTYNYSIRHSRLLGLISDGVSSGGVTFTIGYGGASSGADTQYTNLFTASRFVLSASNSYKGATWMSVRSGTTNVANQVLVVELTNGNNRLPATTGLTLGGAPPGVAANAGASAVLLLDGVSQSLGGLATLGTGIYNRVSSTTPDLCAIAINVASSNSAYSFNGVIGGTNANESNISITKLGLGTEVFGGANTYTGQTIVLAGVLEASNSLALGSVLANTIVSNAAQLRLSGGITINEELILAGSGPSGANLGALRSVNGTNTVNGPISFVGGVAGRTQALGGNFIFNGGVTSANLNVMFASSGQSTTINSNPVKIGTATLWAHDGGFTYLNVASNVMGTLNPAWYNTVVIGVSNALPTNVVLDIGMNTTSAASGVGTLDLNGYDVICGRLMSSYSNGLAQPTNLVVRNTSVAPATLTVNMAVNALYEGLLVGNLSLLKSGPGTLTLTATNTYSGTTTISNGTLALSGGSSLLSSSIALGPGGTLSVTGRIDGAITLASNQTLSGRGQVLGIVTNGGTVSPGSTTGTLTIANYAQTSAGSLNIEIGGTSPSDYDSLTVVNASLDGVLNLSLVNGFAPALDDAFVIVNGSGTITGTFATTNGPAPGPGLAWDIQYFPNFVLLTVVSAPPSGYAAFAQAIPNATQRGYQDDPDADGYANLLEYATGGNPTNSDAIASMNGARTNGVLALKFTRNTNAVDATLIVEGGYDSTNNATWTGIAANSNGTWTGTATVVEDGTNPRAVVVQDTEPAATNRFLRLRITSP